MITDFPYILSYREQQQLFLFEKAYIGGVLFKVGGLSTLIARFIVQFFWNPAIACILTVSLLAVSAYITWLAVRRSASDWRIAPLCIIPALLMGASICENSMHFDALISWMLCLAAMAVYAKIKARRLPWGVLLTVILYFAAGPAAIVFAVSAFAIDCFKGRVSSIVYLLCAFACAFLSYELAWVPTWKAALTPTLFYDLDATMPSVHWAPWIAVPVVIVAAEVLDLLSQKKKTILIASSLAFVAVLPLSLGIAGKFCDKRVATICEYEYYTVNERWSDLIDCCKKHEWMPITANYLNMALSYEGKLCDDLFKYDQRGPISLVMTHKDRGVDVSQAHIMFAMGNFSAAQAVAFNTLLSLNGLCPPMVKMNAVIDILRGSYDVADKYLTILEKAPHYRKWAKQQRHFLWNDAELESDPVLGCRRNNFPESGLALYTDPMTELYYILEHNPSDKQAMQYALSYLMLAKDMNSVCQLVDAFYGTPCLTELPVPVQEAVLFQSEYLRNVGNIDSLSEEWCLSHGVTPNTFRRFEGFKQASLQNGGKAPARFRGSFWYYLTAVQI